MHLICAVSNQMGISFNQRRVSRDKAIYTDIANLIGEKNLYMDPYSAPLFADLKDRLSICCPENYLAEAGCDDYVFFEKGDLTQQQVQSLVLYRFNREYPSDFNLPIDFTRFEKLSQTEFEGSSHEVITREIWQRRNPNETETQN